MHGLRGPLGANSRFLLCAGLLNLLLLLLPRRWAPDIRPHLPS